MMGVQIVMIVKTHRWMKLILDKRLLIRLRKKCQRIRMTQTIVTMIQQRNKDLELNSMELKRRKGRKLRESVD
jgi:hypothetical protein